MRTDIDPARLSLPFEEVMGLLENLPEDCIATALRLVAYHMANGHGIRDDEKTANHLGIHGRRWNRMRRDLAAVFDVEGGAWVLPALAEIEKDLVEKVEKRRARACRGRAGKKASKPASKVIEIPTREAASAMAAAKPARAQVSDLQSKPIPEQTKPASPQRPLRKGEQATLFGGPSRPAAARDDAKDLMGETWKLAIKLLADAGKDEGAARRFIGMLLRDWDAGFVITAIQMTASRGEGVADPMSFIRGILKKYPRKGDNASTAASPARASNGKGPAPEKPFRPLASAKTLGLSESKVERIRRNNRTVHKFKFVDGPPVPAMAGGNAK